MDLARQITGRVFVSQTGPFLVSGSPEFHQLHLCLARLSEPPHRSETPTPTDLGFAPHQITPLNGEILNAWGRGLQKWRKILDDYEKPRQKTAGRRKKYRRWRDEVDQISHVLEALWQTLRQWEVGEQIVGDPYVRVDLTDLATPAPFVEPLWNWFEQLVVWIAGGAAGSRFHRSLSPAAEDQTLFGKRHHFARVLLQLEALQNRHQHLSKRELAAAVREAIYSIPEDIRAEFGFSIPSRPRDFSIADIVATCSNAATHHLPPHPLVGSAAALCASDGATTPLPTWLLSSCDGVTNHSRVGALKSLFDEHEKPGYENLLGALSSMPGVPAQVFDAVRQFLLVGADADDISWGLQNLPLWRGLAENGLSPQPFRALISVLEQAGLTIDSLYGCDITPHEVVERIVARQSSDLLEAFTMWLTTLEAGSLSDHLARRSWNCLCQLLVLEGSSPAFRDVLNHWADPTDITISYPLPAATSPAVRTWLSRLGHYQELCGRTAGIPGSVAKLLSNGKRQDQELEYLRRATDDMQFNERMAARLRLLESRDGTAWVATEERLIKQLREVCAHTALEAAQHLVRRQAHRVWRHLLGCMPPTDLTEDETTAIAAWATGLDDKARDFTRELIDGWGGHGMEYRRHLTANSAWIETASQRMNVEAWLTSTACEIEIDGIPVAIGASSNPFKVFLMGSYFGTCLSLDGSNRDSVLANAYDANKAVIFAVGAEGQILGRKLICINAEHKLIGYQTYVSGRDVITETMREHIASAVDAFCGRLAQRAGIPLGVTGIPEKLSGLFWLDDGVRSWSSGAMRAWANPGAEVEACMAGADLAPPMAQALRERHKKCIDLLTGLGIWPPFGSDGDVGLESMPGLAEETLALVARTVGDRGLARLVLENAFTSGGHVEALTAVTVLEKTDQLVEHVSNVWRDYGSGDRAMYLLSRVASPMAWQLFMERVVGFQVCRVDSVWLPLAIASSQDATDALVQTLLVTQDWHLDYEDLLLTFEILDMRGKTLPQGVVVRALELEFDGVDGRLGLAQWGPECSNALKRSSIRTIARADTEKFFSATDPDRARRAAMAAVVVAMRNRGAKSTAYLRETAGQDPSALLALALKGEGRQRGFIRKTVLAASTDPATILALLESEGIDEAVAILGPTLRDLPGRQDRLRRVITLRKAFQDLDEGRAVSCLSEVGRFRRPLALLPFVLTWLIKWTDPQAPNVKALAALTESENFEDLLEATAIDIVGLVARMASLLRQVDDESVAALRGALQAVLSIKVRLRDGEYALLLGKLSGHRLWMDRPDCERPKLSAEETLGSCGAWGLLIDEEGNQLPVVKWIEVDNLRFILFPPDPHVAARAMELLGSFNPTKEQVEELRPRTEIERQLLLRCIPAARP